MASSTISKKAVIEFVRSAVNGNPLTIELASGGAYVLVGTSGEASLNFMGIINVTSAGAVLYTPTTSTPTSISVTTSTNSITITNSSAVGSKISLIHLAN